MTEPSLFPGYDALVRKMRGGDAPDWSMTVRRKPWWRRALAWVLS
jgi:hypothetical protein